ncbi:MAG: hypothetical protein RLZZ196_699 [Bacteroidota bacterium]|jgi:hypothetical protein
MNELIAKLYDQALVIQEGENFVSGNLDPVKFAELIVQEVFEMIADERFEIYPPVVQRVRQRFGISDE